MCRIVQDCCCCWKSPRVATLNRWLCNTAADGFRLAGLDSSVASPSSSFTDDICCVNVLNGWKAEDIEGRGLFELELAWELRRELADNVAIRPRARIAFPVF